jgi:predicted SAM-dependent methyltransferase
VEETISNTLRINIGCGATPTPDWRNYDNSQTIRIAKIPLLVRVLSALKLLNAKQKNYSDFLTSNSINYADARRRIPEAAGSVDVVYSSHMLEHLDRREALAFLAEAKRVLKRGGRIRLAVPGLRQIVDNYLESENADDFMIETRLQRTTLTSVSEKFKYLIVGDRGHKFLYDEMSLVKLLGIAGFAEVEALPPGATNIPDPGHLNLKERFPESIFVEAVNPQDPVLTHQSGL